MISDYCTKLIVDIIETIQADSLYLSTAKMVDIGCLKSWWEKVGNKPVSYLCVSIDSVAQHSVVCYLIGSARFTKRLIAHWSAALSLYLELSRS